MTSNDRFLQTLLFLHVETPLHAGSGRGLGGVDLPIQRDRVTNYPIVQSSSLKGRLRAFLRDEKYGGNDNHPELLAIFGAAENEEGDRRSYAGAVSVGDAHLLLFPVRSLTGVFAWVTSWDVLARLQRDLCAARIPYDWKLPDDEPAEGRCLVNPDLVNPERCAVKDDRGNVTLEEFTYTAQPSNDVKGIANWLVNNALPSPATGEYGYWKKNLSAHLIILRREDFRDFTQFGTEVSTHIKLVPETKTVAGGALWTVESLPTDSLLYAPLTITSSRAQNNHHKDANEIDSLLRELHHKRAQLGGDETTGHGVVMLRFHDKEAK